MVQYELVLRSVYYEYTVYGHASGGVGWTRIRLEASTH
jgi:hypothetical protein